MSKSEPYGWHYARSRKPMTIRETPADRRREAAAAARLEAAWGVTAVRFPARHETDYFLERGGELVGLLEIKCRTTRFRGYPRFMLDWHKWSANVRAGHALMVRPFLMGAFTDGDHFLDMSATPLAGRGINGRTDRDDRLDRDLVVYLDWSQFWPLHAVPHWT